jgi:hypothetical protein
MTQFTGMPSSQNENTSVNPIDATVAVEQKPGFEEAKFIADYLKGFDRKMYETHSIEENEDDTLKDFKDQYHMLRALIAKHGLTEEELGLTKTNIADFEYISVM